MRALAFLGLLMAALFSAPAYAADITVYSSGNIAIGDSRQFTAYVPLSPNTVTWAVNGIPGGNSSFGTVSDTGLYKSPAEVPTANAVTVSATSTAYPTKSGSITLTVTQIPVQLWSLSPTSVPAGNFTIRINGANITPQSVIYAGDTALATTYISSTSARASGTAQAGAQLMIRVKNPGLGGTISPPVALRVAAATGDPAPTNPSGVTPTPTPTPVPTNPSGVTPTPTPTIGVSIAPALTTLAPSATQQYTATVTGTSTTAVTYTVNGVTGGNAQVGTITPAGLYTAPAATPTGAVTIRATTIATPATSATATVNVVGPPNAGASAGTANLAAGRFLEQATFGPTPSDIVRVNQMGIDAWLNEQFALPETVIPNPGSMNSSQVQQQYLGRISSAQDQLRQRVANALSQIIVISMNKNIYPDEIVPYLQTLSRNAFGNYRTLLGEISTSPQMGKYLDLANSNKPTGASGANENYARELLQLFSIGLVTLNPDGTPLLDANGKTVPTYDQATVQQVALALTGWTYTGPRNNNWENFTGPLEPKDVNHDMRAKAFLGCNLPANQSAALDMAATLDCIFRHPNVGPFISLRLIRSLVMSNPPPAYVQRVAAVFADNGFGVRGDLKAVVKAILTDVDARNDALTADAGRLRDPIGHVVAFVRAMGGRIADSNGLPWQFSQMAQTPLTPPSVFSYYSPMYRIPKSSLTGPEFQIYTPTEAVLRGNMFWQIIANPSSDFTLDLTPFTVAAGDTIQLIDRVDQALFYGRMPQPMRQSLATAIVAQSGTSPRVQTALYLAALSGLYAVQY